MLYSLILMFACNTETKTTPQQLPTDWKAEFEKRKGDYGYATANFEEFNTQIKECKSWFGDKASVACLADCSVYSLERYAYNFDHPENARPVEPQVRAQYGNGVCK